MCARPEQQLVSANANVGAAVASFFPTISLTTSLWRVLLEQAPSTRPAA